jgi:hypothetical protein
LLVRRTWAHESVRSLESAYLLVRAALFDMSPPDTREADRWLHDAFGARMTCAKITTTQMDFTAGVMAQIAHQGQREITRSQHTAGRTPVPAEGARVVAGTFGFSAFVIILTSGLLAIIFPGTILTVLAVLLSLGVSAFTHIHNALVMVNGAASNTTLMLAVSAVFGCVLALVTRVGRFTTRAVREA